MANFASDNCSGLHPAILKALGECNHGMMPSYGGDALTRQLEDKWNIVFEKEVTAALVATGTAANCLALSTYTPPYGAILCHTDAHIHLDEYGAPGLFTGGAQLIPMEGKHGKITKATIEHTLKKLASCSVKPSMLSLTQATESGTVYSLEELAELAHIARRAGMKVHMDGARFANALATLGCTAAQMTWQSGIDILSFGATKNGCMAAEAVIVFDHDAQLKEALLWRRKKSGHTLSKMRFAAAQWVAYLQDDVWLASARHANAMARQLALALEKKTGRAPLHPVEANEVFFPLDTHLAQSLLAAGHAFFEWPDDCYRFVTSFATRPEDITALLTSMNALKPLHECTAQ